MGELELPTGEIIACDPLITALERPAFSRKVKPGRYPVVLLQAQGCTAAAVLRFGPGLPVRWELATFASDRPPVYKSQFLEFIPSMTQLLSFMDKSAPDADDRAAEELDGSSLADVWPVLSEQKGWRA